MTVPATPGVENPLGVPCRYCGSDDTWVYLSLEARPPGTYSLSGAQDKVAASPWPYARCGGCGHVSRGTRVAVVRHTGTP